MTYGQWCEFVLNAFDWYLEKDWVGKDFFCGYIAGEHMVQVWIHEDEIVFELMWMPLGQSMYWIEGTELNLIPWVRELVLRAKR